MEDIFYRINKDGEADHCNTSYMLKSDLAKHDERIRKEAEANVIECLVTNGILSPDGDAVAWIGAAINGESNTEQEKNEWDNLTKEEMWNTIQEIRKFVNSDGTKSITADIEDYTNKLLNSAADRAEKSIRDGCWDGCSGCNFHSSDCDMINDLRESITCQ